ncbi:Heat shock protein hsp-16.2 [Acropora cervicornis]|uniref:Heat shock protein hsp-16.2 n=1 Tax=Acropora cervicornis TaxID=6130 RepID=A0AAD9QU65_ACRCE|nr:Heat shock protein hsp-16.2 [Acropora cervicornis]
MALVFRFPIYHPICSPYSQVVPRSRFFDDLWRDIALAFVQDNRPASCGREQSAQGPIKIATIPLNQYKPEDISLDVDAEKITLYGQHRSEDENGFENSQFKKVIKIPDGVDPTSVASTASEDGRALVLTGIKRVEEKKEDDDNKFAVKLNLSGYKPDEIKVQLRGQELTVTGKQRSEEDGLQRSRDYHRRILLPDDADLSSVTSRLSKEGLLTIEAPRDAALLPSERSLDVTMEEVESQINDEAKSLSDAEEE